MNHIQHYIRVLGWSVICFMGLLMKIHDEIKQLFDIACKSLSTVLLTGATGTGKSSLAQRIHEAGIRKHKPFVSVNLATLYEGTLESELFGHEKGAFTGADRKRIGKLELAHGGTLFLDEIGELSMKLQARLLEFLQSHTLSPVGSNRTVQLDVRVIAATHRELEKAVLKGEFRADLFHRLRVISIPLKALNEQPQELDSLVHGCLEEFSKKHQKSVKTLTEGVAERLETYDWPGNIRELRNVLEYAVLSAEGSDIKLTDLPSWLFQSIKAQAEREGGLLFPPNGQSVLGVAEIPMSLDYQDTFARFEREYIRRAFSRNGGRLNRTARQIGLNKTTLLRRLRAHGLHPSFLGS